MVKLVTYKEKENSEAAREKESLNYKGRHMKLVADLSTKIWQAIREWKKIFNVLNRKIHSK